MNHDDPSSVDYGDVPDNHPTKYVVVWDYVDGHSSGQFPERFDTEAEAEAFGENWVAETLADMRAEGDLPDEEGAAGWPVFDVEPLEPEEA